MGRTRMWGILSSVVAVGSRLRRSRNKDSQSGANGVGPSTPTKEKEMMNQRRVSTVDNNPAHDMTDEEWMAVKAIAARNTREAVDIDEPAMADEMPDGGRALFYPEIPWGAPPTWKGTFMRGVRFLQFWDIFTAFACLYVAWAVPYKLGFMSVDDEPRCHIGPPQAASELNLKEAIERVMAIGDLCSDVFFASDIFVQFHTAEWVVSTVGRPHFRLRHSLREIRASYMRSTFVFDLLGIVPVQYVDCVFEPGTLPSGIKALHLVRLIKLLRLYRIRKLIKALYIKFPKSALYITSMELLLTLVVAAHWMACVWFFTGYPDGWVSREFDKTPEMLEGPHFLWVQWISSFYFAITTMSTIGYGDITADSSLERVVAVCCMVTGCVFFAMLTGTITRVLGSKVASQERFDDLIDEVGQFLDSRNIPQEVRQKILNFYMLRFPTMHIFDEMTILKDLPDGLRTEISTFLYSDIVETVPILRHVSPAAKMAMCRMLRPVFMSEGIRVTAEGEDPDSMYIVRFGQISLESNGKELKVIGQGEVFGENAIFGMSVDGKRTRTAYAKTMAELCVLRANEVRELMVRHKSFQWAVQRMCNLHLDWVAESIHAREKLWPVDMLCINWKMHCEKMECDVIVTALRDIRAGIDRDSDPSDPESGVMDKNVSNYIKEYMGMHKEKSSALIEDGDVELAVVEKQEHYITTVVWFEFAEVVSTNLDPSVLAFIPETGKAYMQVNWPGDPRCQCSNAIVGMGPLFDYTVVDGQLSMRFPGNEVEIEIWLKTASNDWHEMPPVSIVMCLADSEEVREMKWKRRESSARASVDENASKNQAKDNTTRFSKRKFSIRPAGSEDKTQQPVMNPLETVYNQISNGEFCEDKIKVIGCGTVALADLISKRLSTPSFDTAQPIGSLGCDETQVQEGEAGADDQDLAPFQHRVPLKGIGLEFDASLLKNFDASKTNGNSKGQNGIDTARSPALGATSSGDISIVFYSKVRREISRHSQWRRLLEYFRRSTLTARTRYFFTRQLLLVDKMKLKQERYSKEVYRQRRHMHIKASLENYSEFKETMDRFDKIESELSSINAGLGTIRERTASMQIGDSTPKLPKTPGGILLARQLGTFKGSSKEHEVQADSENLLKSEVASKIFKGLEDSSKSSSKAPVSPPTPRDDSPPEMGGPALPSSRRYLDDSPDQEREWRAKSAEGSYASTEAKRSLGSEVTGAKDSRENRGGETSGSTRRDGGQVEELLRQILAKQSQAETERLKDRREFSLWRHQQDTWATSMESRVRAIAQELADAKKMSTDQGAKGKDDFSVVSSVQTIQEFGWGLASGIGMAATSPSKDSSGKSLSPRKERDQAKPEQQPWRSWH